MKMDALGIQTVPAGEQYILYGLNFNKLCTDMSNTMQTFYFSTKEMAQEVYVTLQYFLGNWERGYHGGELGSGLRRCDPDYIGVIPPNAIGAHLLTKINDEDLMNPRGNVVRISTLVQRSNELNKHVCVVTRNPTGLPKGMYDEHMLAVLRQIGLPPRIKRQTFTLNPFKYDYVETDEDTVRKMRLVVRTVVVPAN
jgi:hypothetical protein